MVNHDLLTALGNATEVLVATSSLYSAVDQALQLRPKPFSFAKAAERECCEAAYIACLRRRDVNEAHSLTGFTALMRASEDGALRLCQLLCEQKADVDKRSVGGSTAISLALDTTCFRCFQAGRESCCCPRAAIAQLLLQESTCGQMDLEGAFVTSVRAALQDASFVPVLEAFVKQKHMLVDAEVQTVDSRRSVALAIALERQITPAENAIVNRPHVVETLLSLKADPSREGTYTAWWGGEVHNSLLSFGMANECDPVSLELLVNACAKHKKN